METTPSMLRTLLIMGGTTALSLMIDLVPSTYCHAWSRAYSTGTFKSAVSKGSGNGSYKLRNLKDGADWEEERVEVMTQFCFATEALALEKHLSGTNSYSWGMEEKRARANRLP